MPAAELTELRRRLRRSRVMDATLKRAWLKVLPVMTPAHREELSRILELEEGDACAGDEPAR